MSSPSIPLAQAWARLRTDGLISSNRSVKLWRDADGNHHSAVDCRKAADEVTLDADAIVALDERHWCDCGGAASTDEQRTASYAAYVFAIEERVRQGEPPQAWNEIHQLLTQQDFIGLPRHFGVYADVLPFLADARRQATEQLLQMARQATDVTALERVLVRYSLVDDCPDLTIDRLDVSCWADEGRHQAGVPTGVRPPRRGWIIARAAELDRYAQDRSDEPGARLVVLAAPTGVIPATNLTPAVLLYAWHRNRSTSRDLMWFHAPIAVAAGLRSAGGAGLRLGVSTVDPPGPEECELAARLYHDNEGALPLDTCISQAVKL